MKLVFCAVRDSALVAFTRPFTVPTVGVAVRGFADECARTESDLCKHPTDYELFELGTFDEESGVFVMLERPRSLARALDFTSVGYQSGGFDASKS